MEEKVLFLNKLSAQYDLHPELYAEIKQSFN